MEYFQLVSPCLGASLAPLAELRLLQEMEIQGISLLGLPHRGYLTFCDRLPQNNSNNAYCASTILVPPSLQADLKAIFSSATIIPVEDPRAIFIDLLAYLQKNDLLGYTSLLPDPCVISPEAKIGERVVIEPGVHIDAGVQVGSGTVIRSGTWLRAGVTVGENSVIGTTGINAYVGKDGKRRGFPHLAGVIIDEGVSLGALTVVVRGILSSTRIGARSTIGNLCNIGHGVEIGEDVWISAGTMVGGHATIGSKATIAMGCAIRDNIIIGVSAHVGMGSVLTKNVHPGKSVFGNPAKTFSALGTGPER